MNKFMLDMKVKENGKTNEAMAKLLGIDVATYYRKRNGDSEFTLRELQVLRQELSLSPNEFDIIFFGKELT